MDRVFVGSADPCDIAGSWSASFNNTQLAAVLEQAATRAAQTGQATLASLILPASSGDALRVFQAFQQGYNGECFYWEQPTRQTALVGAGSAFAIAATGSERFTDAVQAWQTLRTQAVIHDLTASATPTAHGPVLFGGFRFDNLHPTTPLWQAFPAGLLILPRLLFSQQSLLATLTLSQMVTAHDDLAHLACLLTRDLEQFQRSLASDGQQTIVPLPPRRPYAMHDVLPARTWKNLVKHAVQTIQQGEYAKIVLARAVDVAAGKGQFSLAATLQRLRENYPAANIFAFQRGTITFIGATPERLVYAQEGTLHTVALAGSAPRGATPEEDRQFGSALLNSPKNRQEHEIVTSSIRDALTQLCSRVWVTDTPELLRLKNIQHLQTAIVGELLPGRSILETLATLHPTPAVGGSPTATALAFIRAYENLDRGWYAGPIGWIDLEGNGEFAVALRTALLEKDQAHLFAGCGIVADSDPTAEYAESCLKLQVISRSLSGQE